MSFPCGLRCPTCEADMPVCEHIVPAIQAGEKWARTKGRNDYWKEIVARLPDRCDACQAKGVSVPVEELCRMCFVVTEIKGES